MEGLVLGVVALVAIAFSTAVSPRVGVAAPLILVALGLGASFLPFVPDVSVDPEVILAGVLPPLLYAAGASIPATDFRREFRSIGALSIALVILSAAVLGVFFHWVIPDLSWPWAFAIGAIVSPTDPVATGIIKRLGVSPRVVSLLEGESLLNDATSLVLLRGAVTAAAATYTLWDVALEFVLAMTVAVAIGWAVGRLNLWVRARIRDTTANTVFAFTIPFVASIPAELVGASGLVAAVVAGIVTGNGAARALSPQVRRSDHQTWKAIELMLEGFVYLILGLELMDVVQDVYDVHDDVWFAIGAGAAALAVALVVRAGFLAPLLWRQARRASRAEQLRPHLDQIRERMDDPEQAAAIMEHPRVQSRLGRARPTQQHVKRQLSRAQADISYLTRGRLGPREGALMVWAGMRGVVTVAAAQTLPLDSPHRSLLILIAFSAAVLSLAVQGGTVAWVVRWLKPARGATPEEFEADRARLRADLEAAAADARKDFRESGQDGHGHSQHIAVIEAKRAALLDARAVGMYSSAVLTAMLHELDVEQIRLEL